MPADGAANDYHFVTRWEIPGTCEDISEVLGNPLDLPRWWPSVYLKVDELRPPDARGHGRRVRLLTKGRLPYRLRWEFEVVESCHPYGFTIDATGDFQGCGVWTFAQHAGLVDVTFDWRIRAEKALLRNLSFILKPIFEANHRWAMAQGEICLKREMSRRHRP
jgi:hypothetical protein